MELQPLYSADEMRDLEARAIERLTATGASVDGARRGCGGRGDHPPVPRR